MPAYTTTVPSPLGPLRLDADDHGLCGLYLPDHRRAPDPPATDAPRHPHLARAAAELVDYFAARRRTFTVPLSPHGTPFQRDVWAQLQAIPYGERRTYADLARALHRPTAARAVGHANARNPLSILIPCHRVLGSDGALHGYAGGEPAKRWLLDFEAAHADQAVSGDREPARHAISVGPSLGIAGP